MLKKAAICIIGLALTGCVSWPHHKKDMDAVNANFIAQANLDRSYQDQISLVNALAKAGHDELTREVKNVQENLDHLAKTVDSLKRKLALAPKK